jgi:AsmA protein
MGKILKLVGLVVGAVVALVAVALVAVVLFFDPNDYRPQIVQAVADATGRELTLEGELELAVFPRISIALGPASISNAPGFGEQPFARIEAARLQLELLPLLRREVQVGRAELRGLELNLARNAAGVDNWQDLAGDTAEAPTASEPAGDDVGPAIALDVGELAITGADVSWNDAAAGTSWTLTDFNLAASGFGPGAAFPLSMDFDLAGEGVALAVELSTQATLDITDNQYRLEDLVVAIAGEGENWPGEAGEIGLESELLDANLATEALTLEGLVVDALGLTISGNLSGQNLVSNLSLTGDIAIASFDPRAILEQLEVEVDTADPNVLGSAEVRGRFVHNARESALENLALTLDDTQMTGRAGLAGEALRFDIAIDSIDIDRYLPPAAAEEGQAEAEGSLDEVDLPLEVLRTLQAQGQLAMGQAKFLGLSLSNARFALTAGNGQLRLTPEAALYGGSLAGTIAIAVQGEDTARITLNQALEGVDMLALGRDFLGSEMVSGTGTLRLDLVGIGANLGDVERGLDGDVEFAITDGAWQGMDLWYELRRARAVLDREAAPERTGARETAFSSVSATGVIEDAVLINRDLTAELPFMRVTGSGSANLITDEMDFELTAAFIDSPALQAEPSMADLAGTSLPFTVTGTVSEPSVRPDFGAVVRARVQEEVREEVEEAETELEQRAEEAIEERREELGERLRGLFNR